MLFTIITSKQCQKKVAKRTNSCEKLFTESWIFVTLSEQESSFPQLYTLHMITYYINSNLVLRIIVNWNLSLKVEDGCPTYHEKRTEDSPPSYTEAVQSNNSSSIWTTPITQASSKTSPTPPKRSPIRSGSDFFSYKVLNCCYL